MKRARRSRRQADAPKPEDLQQALAVLRLWLDIEAPKRERDLQRYRSIAGERHTAPEGYIDAKQRAEQVRTHLFQRELALLTAVRPDLTAEQRHRLAADLVRRLLDARLDSLDAVGIGIERPSGRMEMAFRRVLARIARHPAEASVPLREAILRAGNAIRENEEPAPLVPPQALERTARELLRDVRRNPDSYSGHARHYLLNSARLIQQAYAAVPEEPATNPTPWTDAGC